MFTYIKNLNWTYLFVILCKFTGNHVRLHLFHKLVCGMNVASKLDYPRSFEGSPTKIYQQ